MEQRALRLTVPAPAQMRRYLPVLIALVGVAAIGIPLVLAWPLIVGFEGRADTLPIQPHELTEQVADITKYMQGLATSVLGLIGFLLSQRVSNYWNQLSIARRVVVVAGALLCAVSICVGLLQFWAILSLSADGVVRSGLSRVLMLSVVQAMQLGLGVLMIGCTALFAVGSPAATTSSDVLAQGMTGGKP